MKIEISDNEARWLITTIDSSTSCMVNRSLENVRKILASKLKGKEPSTFGPAKTKEWTDRASYIAKRSRKLF